MRGEGQREPAAVRAPRDRWDFRRRKGTLQEGAGTALAGSECRPALGKTPWETRECELRAGSMVPWNMSWSSQSGTRTSHLNFSEPQFLHLSKSRCMRFKSFLLR